MSYRFSEHFPGVFQPGERARIHAEVERDADLDALRSALAFYGRTGIDRRRVLMLIVNAAAASLRQTGAIDWREVCATLVRDPEHSDAVAAQALELMARELAEPGVAAKET